MIFTGFVYRLGQLVFNQLRRVRLPYPVPSFEGDATVVTARAGEDKKPKHADELAWPLIILP
jgi:hypothetical protein